MKRMSFLLFVIVFVLMAISAVAQEQEAVVDSTFFHFPVFHLGQTIEPDGGWEELDRLIAESEDYDLEFQGQADDSVKAYDNLAKGVELRLDKKGRLLQTIGQEAIARWRAMAVREHVGRGNVFAKPVRSAEDRGVWVIRIPRKAIKQVAAFSDESASMPADSSAKKDEAAAANAAAVAKAKAEDGAQKAGVDDANSAPNIRLILDYVSVGVGHESSPYGYNGVVGTGAITLPPRNPNTIGFSFSVVGIAGRTTINEGSSYLLTLQLLTRAKYNILPWLGVSFSGGYRQWTDVMNHPPEPNNYNRYTQQFVGWQAGPAVEVGPVTIAHFWAQGSLDKWNRDGEDNFTIQDYRHIAKQNGVTVTVNPIKLYELIF